MMVKRRPGRRSKMDGEDEDDGVCLVDRYIPQATSGEILAIYLLLVAADCLQDV